MAGGRVEGRLSAVSSKSLEISSVVSKASSNTRRSNRVAGGAARVAPTALVTTDGRGGVDVAALLVSLAATVVAISGAEMHHSDDERSAIPTV